MTARFTDESGNTRLVGTLTGGGGGATVFVQDADPGAVGAGALWLNTTDPGHGVPASVRPLLVRNASDTGWDDLGLVHRDGGGAVRAIVTMSDDAIAIERFTALGALAGSIFMQDSSVLVSSSGTGGVRIDSATGAVLLQNTVKLTEAGEVGFFNSATPVAQQTVTGMLSAVADPNAKAVLTSLIAALAGATGYNLLADGTN